MLTAQRQQREEVVVVTELPRLRLRGLVSGSKAGAPRRIGSPQRITTSCR
ncbi:hypothetical protein ACFFKE_25400 [Streptomyces mutabilis]